MLFILRFKAVIVIHNFIGASILLSGSIVLFCLSPTHTHSSTLALMTRTCVCVKECGARWTSITIKSLHLFAFRSYNFFFSIFSSWRFLFVQLFSFICVLYNFFFHYAYLLSCFPTQFELRMRLVNVNIAIIIH